jgi:hypothetical protein
MKKLVITATLLLAAASALAAPNMKAGLWEFHIIKQTVDGKDMTAQMAAARAQMQQMLANMPPEQRKQLEQSMGAQAMPDSNNTQRICISPEMAAQDKPMPPAEAKCEPTNIVHNGNKTTFELNCPGITGKGETVINGDTVHSKMDMVRSDARGRHTMQSESEMKYLGADCKGIKPVDQVVREMQKGQRK